MAFKTWFNPWIKGSEGIAWGRRRRTYVCHKGWNLQTISTMHPKKGIIPLLLRKIQTPPCFHPSMSIIIYPYKSREMAKNRVVFFTWKWWQLNNSIDFACSLLLPLRKKPNSHNFRNMSKSGVISLIDWKIKKVGLDLVNYFLIEIDINPIESFFSNNFD